MTAPLSDASASALGDIVLGNAVLAPSEVAAVERRLRLSSPSAARRRGWLAPAPATTPA
jgi:hypothetical protein